MELKELNGKVNYESTGLNSIYNEDNKKRMNDFFSLRYSLKNKPEENEQDEEEDLEEDTGWNDIFANTDESDETPAEQSVEQNKDISNDLKTLLGMFNTAGIKIKMTSGYREGAKTKQGNVSHHSTGNAMDIVPEDGNFKALAEAIRNNPEISTFMKSKGLGVLDETTAEMLARTGGTGAHFHIGPDKIAQDFWKV